MAKAPTINCGEIDFFIKTHRPDPNFQQIVNDAIIKAATEAMNSVGKSMSEVIEKMDQPIPNPFEIKFQLLNSDVWETAHRCYTDEVEAIRAALLYSHNRPNHVVGVFMEDLIVTRIRNGEPTYVNVGHEEKVLATLDTDFQNQMLDDWFGPTKEAPENQSIGFAGAISGDFYSGYGGYIRATSKDVSLLEIGKRIKFGLQDESYTIIEILRDDNPLDILLDRPLERIIYNNFKIISCASDVQNQPVDVVMDITVSCPDCKDGFYYPFAGPKEPCRTCHG